MPDPLAQILAYHRRTQHAFEAYAAGPQTLDWDSQPAAFRHFPGSRQIALPRLQALPTNTALAQALARPFAGLTEGPAQPMGLQSLGAWLQLALGLAAWKRLGPDRWAVRANPSSGNLHPIEGYLLVSGLAELDDGLYHYRPDTHALELRARHSQGDGRPRVSLLLSSVTWRETWKYGERAFRYCQLDAGHAAACADVAASALGWRLGLREDLGGSSLACLAGLDREADFPYRRAAYSEREDAEMLLQLDFPGAAPAQAEADLLQRAQQAQWSGPATGIDRHPMFRWPAVEEIVQASRLPSSPASAAQAPHPHTAPPAWPAGCGERGVAELILGRRSAQRFDSRYELPRQRFASLLARLQGDDGVPWRLDGGAPDIDLLLFVHRVEGLTPGLYLLPRCATRLPRLRERLGSAGQPKAVEGLAPLLALRERESAELKRLCRALHCHQELAASACFAVAMLADLPAALQAQGSAAYRRLLREAGLLGQVLYLQAEAHGVNGTGIGCFFDAEVADLVAPSGLLPLYHFTVGLARSDPRIETTPAYD